MRDQFLCGYIIAGSENLPYVYMVPIETALDSIRAHFKCDCVSVSGEDVLRAIKFLSDPSTSIPDDAPPSVSLPSTDRPPGTPRKADHPDHSSMDEPDTERQRLAEYQVLYNSLDHEGKKRVRRQLNQIHLDSLDSRIYNRSFSRVKDHKAMCDSEIDNSNIEIRPPVDSDYWY